MKKILSAVWNFLVEVAEHRARNVRYYGWY